MTTDLTIIERASIALGASEIEKKLTELAKQSKDIVTITNAAGYQECHATRMVLKNERISLQKLGKDARDDATKFSRAVIAEEGRLISIISLEEDRLEILQKSWDDAREAEKQAKIQAEMKRVSDIQKRILIIKEYYFGLFQCTSEELLFYIESYKNLPLDSFEEFEDDANTAYAESLAKLEDMVAQALKREEEEKIEAARQEVLKKQLAKQEEANRLERLELAELRAKQLARDAEERQLRDEENARIDAEHKAEAARFAELSRVEQAKIAEEQALIAAERLKLAEEARVIKEAKEAQERADLAVKQEAKRKAADKKTKEDRLKQLSKLKCKSANEALEKILLIAKNDFFNDEDARHEIELIAEANLQTVTA